MENNINCWNIIDKAYCISLRHRGDRRQVAQTEFSKVGLCGKIDYILMDSHPENSEQGIYESHMQCISLGLKSGAQNIAIFEDDIIFDRFNPIQIKQVLHNVMSLDSWDIFFFGCIVSASWSTGISRIRRVRYRSLAHAYLLNRPCAERISTIGWSGEPFDSLLKKLIDRPYAIYPSIAFQSNAKSDNTKHRKLERFRKVCGGLFFIQKMNERYHRHSKLILFLHLVLVMIIGALWLL